MPPTKAAIAADSPLTAAAGARIAEQGGNAVDIAVAAAITAAASEVLMCSLGGSAFFMVRPAGQAAELIDGADAMPTVHQPPASESAAWRNVHVAYGDGIDIQAGAASVAVPGMLAAAETAWQRHGSLPWPEIVAPAIEVARNDIPVTPTLAMWLNMSALPLFSQQPASRDCFAPGGIPLEENQTFRIPRLAGTYQAIADEGARTLYEGDIAASFAEEIQALGGFISRADLAAYQAIVREPLELHSRGFHLALNPPPAVGGVALGCLISMLEANWREDMNAAQRARLQAQAQVALMQLREHQLHDADLDDRAARELLQKSGTPAALPGLKSPHTTHLSVITEDGSMSSVTMSMGYGAGINVPSLGIALNNSLGEPELNPQGFHVAPAGTRLISNMAPTLAWHADGRCLAVGSPGASRITTSIAQTWARFAMEEMTYEAAVEAPRLHIEAYHDQLRAQYEPGIDDSLLADNFVKRPFDSRNMYFGAIKLAALDRARNFHAVADQRRHGAVEFLR